MTIDTRTLVIIILIVACGVLSGLLITGGRESVSSEREYLKRIDSLNVELSAILHLQDSIHREGLRKDSVISKLRTRTRQIRTQTQDEETTFIRAASSSKDSLVLSNFRH